MVLLSDAGTAAAAQSVGIARASFETAHDYVKEREAFGNRLIDHQAVAFQLAAMATYIEPARSLAFAAAALLDAGRESVKEASMAKLRSAEHTSELQSLMRISYAVFCLKKKNILQKHKQTNKS